MTASCSPLPWRSSRPHLAVIALGIGTAAACAPSQSFRPAGALRKDHELGVALSIIGERPYVVEPTRHVGQAWWTERLGRSWSLSALLAADASAAAGGAALRWDFMRTEHWVAATEVEGGFGWAALALPVAFWALPAFGVYCSPRLGNWGPALAPFIPCGLSAHLPRGVSVRAELQLQWVDFEPYNRRLHWGVGVAHEF